MRFLIVAIVLFECSSMITMDYTGSAYNSGNTVHKLKSSYYSKSDYRKPQDDYRNHIDSSAETELYQDQSHELTYEQKSYGKHSRYRPESHKRKKSHRRKYQPAYIYSKYVRPSKNKYIPIEQPKPVYQTSGSYPDATREQKHATNYDQMSGDNGYEVSGSIYGKTGASSMNGYGWSGSDAPMNDDYASGNSKY